jgi:hypothetical protein
MIDFPCICGHPFSVPDELIGRSVQCPDCLRAVDVPNPTDVRQLEPDGTYQVDDAIPLKPETPDTLVEMHRAFTRDRVDDAGNPIDLRVPIVGEIEPIDLAEPESDREPISRPRYDPITGELIRAIDVKPTPENELPQNIPIAAKVVPYARPKLSVSAVGVFFELLMPLNLFVMLFDLVGHLVLVGLMLISFIMLPIPIMLIVLMLLIAHWGNIIEDMGPNELEELPRPLRDFSWIDDIWHPFTRMSFALLVCYWPCIVLPHINPQRGMEIVGWLLLAAGTFMAPAVMLTTITSGSVINLRPDRLLGVIRACGGGYLWLLIMYVVAGWIYLFSFNLTLDGFTVIFSGASGAPTGGGFLLAHGVRVAIPLLLVGIYLMHAFCWYVGRAYVKHHDEFPWALQYYQKAIRPGGLGASGPESPPAPPRGFDVLPVTATPAAAAPAMARNPSTKSAEVRQRLQGNTPARTPPRPRSGPASPPPAAGLE